MGKGARSSKKRAEQFREQQRETASKQAGQKKTKLIAIIVTAVLLCALAALTVRAFVRDTRSTNGYYMRNAVVMSNDKVSVNAAEMSYFIYNQVNNFISNYYSLYNAYYTSLYTSFSGFLKTYTGIDTSVSLKEQYYGSTTWFDYFKSLAESEVAKYIALYSKAVDSGMSLTDDDIAGIEMRASYIDLTAYGSGINRTDVENALTLKALADLYKYSMLDDVEVSEDELNAYFDEKYKSYSFIDYISYTVSFGGENSTVEDKDQAKALADRLAAANDGERFKELIVEIAGKKEAVDTAETTKASYSESNAMKALFDRTAKEFDTYTSENITDGSESGSYTVYMLLKTPYTDDEKTADIRHILVANYESDEAGKAAAEDIYKQLADAGFTEEAFDKLARRYSEDINSLANGGLYMRIHKGGDAAAAFDEWGFGTERSAGDCEVVKTGYGYHVMYFIGYDIGNSMAEAYTDLLNERYSALAEKLVEEYPAVVNAEAYDTIKA